MKNSHEKDSPDFFEEVQKKIERDIFRSVSEESQGTSVGEKVSLKQADATEETAGIDVQVEIVEPDSDITAVDVDDSFLEEIDLLPDYGAADIPAERASRMTGEEMFPVDPSESKNVNLLDEDVDFQEDDRYLNELIDREMVGSGAHGADFGSGGSAFAASVSSPAAEETETEKKELNTRTLAEVYAQQGHYEKAAEIYENLLRDDPGNHDLRSRFDELKDRWTASLKPEAGTGGEIPGGPVPSFPDVRAQMVERLEAWLAGIRAEKERRCLRNA